MTLADEIIYIIIVSLLAYHSYKNHGRTYTLRIFLVGFFMGLIMENTGVTQGSFTEWGYYIYFPGSLVPVITQIGWILVAYVVFGMSDEIFKAWPKLKKNLFVAALIPALIAVFWDILIDPYKVYKGDWVWTEQSWGNRGIGWLDVPIINWLAWFWCLFGWALCTYYINSKADVWSDKKQIGMQFVAIFVTLIIILIGGEISFFLIDGSWTPLWILPEIPIDYPWYWLYEWMGLV